MNHGDFKLGNLFFDDADNAANQVIAFDWQLANRSRADDVAQFISGSFTAETRRRHEKQLLTDYHDSLVERGVQGYSYEELLDDVRLALLLRLPNRMGAVAIHGETMMSTEAGNQILMAHIERLQTLVDWNCDEVIPG